MPIMAARVYRAGKLLCDLAADQALPDPGDPADFFWIGLYETTADEIAAIAARFNLHPLAVEDAVKANQLPKVEVFDDQLFVIVRTAHLAKGSSSGDDGESAGGGIAQGEVAIFVGPNFIVTVRHESARTHTSVREKLEASPARLAHGADAALHGIIDNVVDCYFPVIDAIEERVLDLEDHVMDQALDADQIRTLLQRRHELVRFQRIIGLMKDVVGRLASLDLPNIEPAMRPFFRDVLDHLTRAEFRLTGAREAIGAVVEVNNMLETQRQGVITRQLAAWAAILAVPTAIAGIYGMNFKNMPELGWHAGYPAVVGVMAAICGALYWQFKRIGWL